MRVVREQVRLPSRSPSAIEGYQRAAARGVMLYDSSLCMALRMMGVVRHRSCRSISGGPRLNHRTAGKIVVKGIIAEDRCAVGHIEYRRLWNQL
jgi:hypothetical protein